MTRIWQHLTLAAACILLTATLAACNGQNFDTTADRTLALEAKIHALEESLEALSKENAALKSELANDRRINDLDSRLQELEAIAAEVQSLLPTLQTWLKDKNETAPLPQETVLERTARLAKSAGGEIHYLDHPQRQEPAILITPQKFIDGNTPLIVSLHGFGGNSADHALYVPLHRRLNTDGFALLLPNGIQNPDGNRFWNPTNQCCDSVKTGQDDFAYLSNLVAQANTIKDFGPLYFFGHSNGGFMSYWMACQGLPGLRAIASLAGTSYLDDSHCQGAPPVSVLHIHGTNDNTILFDVDSNPPTKTKAEPPFYAGAQEMITRWAQRAECHWLEPLEPYTTLDLDQHIPGAETQAHRLDPGCPNNINIELWLSQGSDHTPAYNNAFTNALLDWLLSQK